MLAFDRNGWRSSASASQQEPQPYAPHPVLLERRRAVILDLSGLSRGLTGTRTRPGAEKVEVLRDDVNRLPLLPVLCCHSRHSRRPLIATEMPCSSSAAPPRPAAPK